MIAKAKAMRTKAAEKHKSIRKAVGGSRSLSNDAASAAEYKPPIESLFLFLLLQLLLLLLRPVRGFARRLLHNVASEMALAY